VKLLFDENLPHRLVGSLASLFPGSTHVRSVGLARADDSAIWTYAVAHDHVIVSKDEEQWWTARNSLGQTGSIPVPYICKVVIP